MAMALQPTPAPRQTHLFTQDEDWISKKKVETITKRNLERHVQRQVVLNDGRVIVEDVPRVTVDTTEDVQTHEDEGQDDTERAVDAWRPVQDVSNSDVLSERYQRNTNTRDVQQSSTTSAAASHLGEMTPKDVDLVVQRGRDVRSLVKPYDVDGGGALATIPARVIHQNSSNRHLVDREDVHEINRVQDGRLKTDRYVTREVVEDANEDTPEEGTSTDSEFYDADADRYTQRREERSVDYFTVPKGKSLAEGKFLRKGVHMTSQDKDVRKVDPWEGAKGQRARMPLTYRGGDSDSTTNLSDHKPPRPGRSASKGRKGQSSLPGSERSYPLQAVDMNSGTDRRFHTIERSQRVSRGKVSGGTSVLSSASSGGGGRLRPRSSQYSKRLHSVRRQSDSDDHSLRSRSMSRSSQERPGHNKVKMRSDLDSDRAGRLRRAMSFSGRNTHDKNSEDGTKSTNKSFLGSVKTLYASLTRGSSKKQKKSVKEDWFDKGEKRKGAPVRPPRKHHRSTSNLGTDTDRSTPQQDLERGSSGRYSDEHKSRHRTEPVPRYQEYRGHQQHHAQDHQQHQAQEHQQHQAQDHQQHGQHQNTSVVKRRSRAGTRGEDRGRGLERRKTIASYQDLENRDQPKFEARRHRDRSSSRFFGQDDSDDADAARSRERPAPDMRRFLLNNVNVSRRQNTSGGEAEPAGRPTVRAI